jgi:hypothetical protein
MKLATRSFYFVFLASKLSPASLRVWKCACFCQSAFVTWKYACFRQLAFVTWKCTTPRSFSNLDPSHSPFWRRNLMGRIFAPKEVFATLSLQFHKVSNPSFFASLGHVFSGNGLAGQRVVSKRKSSPDKRTCFRWTTCDNLRCVIRKAWIAWRLEGEIPSLA